MTEKLYGNVNRHFYVPYLRENDSLIVYFNHDTLRGSYQLPKLSLRLALNTHLGYLNIITLVSQKRKQNSNG